MRKVGLVSLLIITILLSSCTSLSNALQADLEGVPVWYLAPPASRRNISFVGRGSGSSVREAENIAHQNLLENVSSYLGEDITDQYYRQFTLNDSVVELDLIVERRDERITNTQYTVFYLASAPKETLDLHRSTEYKHILEVETEIQSILDEALEYYKENKDFLTIEKYLEAAILSLQTEGVKEEYDAKVLIDKAYSYLDKIYLTISKENSEKAEARVRARRSKALLDSPISDSGINAYFVLNDAMKTYPIVSNVYLTNNEGYIYFSPINEALIKEGTISFNINLNESISDIEEIAGNGIMDDFKELLSSKKVEFSYSIPPKLNKGQLLVFIDEFDVDGNKLSSSIINDEVISYSQAEGLDAISVTSTEEEDEYIIEDIKNRYPDAAYLLFGRAGEVETFDEGSETYLLFEGHITLTDLTSGETIATNTLTSAFSRGETAEEAREKGLKRFSDIFIAGFSHNL